MAGTPRKSVSLRNRSSMATHTSFTVLACILMVRVAAAEATAKQDSSQDLSTAQSSRFLSFYGGNRNPSYPYNGYGGGSGYYYQNPNYSYHRYPNTGFGNGYPSYNYPNYGNGGYSGSYPSNYPGSYPGGYIGGYPGGYPSTYPGGWGYSSGFGNGYNSGIGTGYNGYSRYKIYPDLPQLTTANGGYIYKK